MIEHHHSHARADQLLGDVGLQIRKAEYEIWRQRENPIDASAGEGAYAGFFLAGLRRPYRESRDPHDPVGLSNTVERFGRLLGQADNPAG